MTSDVLLSRRPVAAGEGGRCAALQDAASASICQAAMRKRPPLGSEGDIVVEILFAARGRRCRRLIVFVSRRCSAAGAALRAAARCARASSRTSAQHLHIVGDDLGGEPIISLLILPFSGSQFSLDEHLRTLAQVFRRNFTQTAEQRDAVPFGAFLLRPGGLVLPGLAGGDSDVRDGHAARHGTRFRVCAEIAYQNDLVYA